jgi:hypothetical protein
MQVGTQRSQGLYMQGKWMSGWVADLVAGGRRCAGSPVPEDVAGGAVGGGRGLWGPGGITASCWRLGSYSTATLLFVASEERRSHPHAVTELTASGTTRQYRSVPYPPWAGRCCTCAVWRPAPDAAGCMPHSCGRTDPAPSAKTPARLVLRVMHQSHSRCPRPLAHRTRASMQPTAQARTRTTQPPPGCGP